MLKPWPLALAIALASGLPLAAVHAENAVQQQVLSFDLPAASLGATLNAIARQSGQIISLDPQLVSGKQAPAVRGTMTAAQAMQQALAGSGLRLIVTDSGSFGVSPEASGDGVLELSSLSITGKALGAVTQGTGSYTTGQTSTATGLPLSMRETPQSVSVMTRQQIEDRGLTTLDDVVQNVTGLVMQKGYYVGDSGSFSARGFPISNLMFDGVPVSTGANGTFNADNDSLDIYDRIEVVRGATGLTTGAGTPSAAINLVRKRPTAEAQAQLTLSAGSWDNYRTVLDVGGPLNDNGTLRARSVVSAQDSQRFYDDVHDSNQQFYSILEADLSDATTASIGIHYRRVDNDGIGEGLPVRADGSFYPGLKRSTAFTNDFDYWKQTDRTVFADLTHQFDNGWQAKLAGIWKRPEQDIMFTGLSNSAGELRQNTQRYRLDNRQDNYEASLSGPFSLLGRSHDLIMGTSYREFDNENWGGWAAYSWSASAPVVDPYNWDSSAVPRPDIDMSLWSQIRSVRQKAVYAATRLHLTDPLKMILGARINWYENDQHSGFGDGFKVTREITPYAGLLYDRNEQHTAYVSWTEIFEPQSSVDASGSLIKPITGTNYELGLKSEYFGGRLNTSIATFLIKQQNRATDDLAGPNPCPGSAWGYCQRASGEVESKGVELEVSGGLTPDWQVTAGYTYVITRYTKDADSSNVGTQFNPSLPRHQMKLSTVYRLPAELSRWRVGGSLYAQNRIHSNDDERIQQSGYFLAGLHTTYDVSANTEVSLNINNLFDKQYYQSLGWMTGGNVVGTPRNFMVTAKHTF